MSTLVEIEVGVIEVASVVAAVAVAVNRELGARKLMIWGQWFAGCGITADHERLRIELVLSLACMTSCDSPLRLISFRFALLEGSLLEDVPT